MITLWHSLRLRPSLASLALSSPELRSLSDRVAEGPSVLSALEPLHRFALYLADPLPRNPQLVRELGQRGRRHRLHCGPDLLNRPTEPGSELLLARFPL